MSTWLKETVAEIRERMTSDDEASLWTLFFDNPEGEPLLASAIDNAMNEMDDDGLRKFAWITKSIGVTAVLFAVIRADGKPRPEDRRTWRKLSALLADGSTQLLGFVVVGVATYWVAGKEDVGSAA